MIYQFNNFELDTEKYELRRAGDAQHIEPLVFDLLHFLCKNPGRVIGHDEFIEGVWKGRIVSDASISGCVKSARKALGDRAESRHFIKTVRGRGFQFVCVVNNGTAVLQRQVDTSKTLQSSLVVLPFQTFGESKEISDIAFGLAENLTTILTRIPLLSLISRSSSFALREEDKNPERVRQMLGATYMLEGSVQQIGESVRANVQLVETKTGFHRWAQQFELPRGPLVMTDILHAILAQLEPQLIRAMFTDLQSEDGELNSRQMLVQAMSLLKLKGWHQDTFMEAAELLRLAIKLEPDLALAHGYLSLILAFGHRVGLLRNSEDVVREAIDEANIALELDNMDSEVVGLAACALADVGMMDRAVPLLRQATEINPNNGQAFAALGAVLSISGHEEEAIEKLEHGIGISPMDSRVAVWGTFLALVYAQSGELDRALDVAQKSCQADDQNYMPKLALAVVRLARSETEAAEQALAECYRVKPDLSEREAVCIVGAEFGGVIGKLRSQTEI